MLIIVCYRCTRALSAHAGYCDQCGFGDALVYIEGGAVYARGLEIWPNPVDRATGKPRGV